MALAGPSRWLCLFILVLLLVPYLIGLSRVVDLCIPPSPSPFGVSPHFRSSTPVPSPPPPPHTTWRLHLLTSHARTLHEIADSSPTSPTTDGDAPLTLYPYAFGLLMHVPLHLGDVLELSEHRHSLLDELLTIEQRSVTSVTRWHPLVHALAAAGQGSTAALSGVPTRRVAHFTDELTAVAEYDTIVVHDAVLTCQRRLSCLHQLKQALRPGGRLIFTAPVDRRELTSNATNSTAEERAAQSPDEPLSMADVDTFLASMQVDYLSDERFYKRVKDELPMLDWPSKPSPRVFIIATSASEARPTDLAPFQPDFYLTWSTNPLKPWRLAVIDSIFFHHPDARVHVYSDELAKDPTPLHIFVKAGYSIEAVAVDYDEIFAGTPILPWILNPDNRAKLNFVSDALRLALVWKRGGCYVDFDAILLKPVHLLRNVMAHELWNNGMVNGAILPFSAGHPFLRLLMLRFPHRVRLDHYTSAGPSLQTHGVHLYRAMQPHLVHEADAPALNGSSGVVELPGTLHIYQPTAFFANAWMDAPDPQYWLPHLFPAELYAKTKREQFIFHIWKQMLGGTLESEKDYVHLDAFMGRLFLDHCRVLCEVHRQRNMDPSKVIVPPPPRKT